MRCLIHDQVEHGRMAARARRGKLRSGVVLVTIIVLIVVSLALFGLWTKSIVREHDRLSLQQFRVQAERLAEAGIERARARRSADAAYSEETWSVPAAELDNVHAGQVRIHVTPIQDGSVTRY